MMKFGQLTVPIIVLLAASILLQSPSNVVFVYAQAQAEPEVFVGVDVAFDNLTATKQLADTLRPYTNLFIIGCDYGINPRNTSRLNDLFSLCQYLYDKGYYFMIFGNVFPTTEVVEHVRQYGNRFLGFYAYDELGGRQLDQADRSVYFTSADNLTDAATKYENQVNNWLYNMSSFFIPEFTRNFDSPKEFKLFTSDYALYWFDFKAGYDVVFAEFAWNYDRQLNIALCRGAATAQGKEWGVMITWKYPEAPYVESAAELYEDMKLAYDNGAKYIVVFDTNANWTASTLTEDQLDAMKMFWQYTQTNPQGDSSPSNRVAYVLPDGYAYGFRGPEDQIWGIWNADETAQLIGAGLSPNINACQLISTSVKIMLDQYKSNVDIVYDEPVQPGTATYNETVLWNDPNAVSEFWPKVSSSATATTTPSRQVDEGDGKNLTSQYLVAAIATATVAFALVIAWTLKKRSFNNT
jgi:hypothetical protein